GLNTGLAAGAGVEWRVNSDWSLKAEYLYADLGEIDSTLVVLDVYQAGHELESSVSLDVHIARVGLSYHF
uniref:outer membrane protein n=1 Tax=Aestuariivirga sp. TaxID=2650926 RepID=UPI00378359C8